MRTLFRIRSWETQEKRFLEQDFTDFKEIESSAGETLKEYILI